VKSAGRLPFAYVGLVLTYLAISVNLSVTSIALPSIATDLSATNTQLSWIFNITPLVSAGLMLFAGAWSDRFGRRLLLVSGLVIFLFSTVLSATATDVNLLILWRAFTGVGSALAMPAALALTFDVVPEQSRRTAIGILGATQAGGSLFGPILAGVALSVWSWPAAFLAVVPFIVIALVASSRLPRAKPETAKPMDMRGAALVSIASVALVYAANQLSARTPIAAILALAVAAVVVVVLIFWERRAPHPLLDASVMRQRGFRIATVVVFGSQIVLGGLLFVLTQYLQLVLGYSPLVAGLLLVPSLTAWIIASSTAGRLSAMLGVRRSVTAGMGLAALGYVLVAVQPASGSTALLIGGLFLTGLLAVGPALMTHTAVNSYRPDQRSIGSAVNGAAARFGFSFGIALFGGLLGAVYALLVAPATSGLSAADEATASGSLAGALKVSSSLADGSALTTAARDAFTSGYVVTVVVAAVICAVLAVIVAVGSERVEDPRHGGARTGA
jgi:DHA2 family multidrug resistance protein-like MFS transporter